MFIGSWQWVDPGVSFGVLDWVAFVLGALGIGFTIFQLLRSKGALQAAREALEETRSSLIKNQLAEALPQFRAIMQQVENSLLQQNTNEQLDGHLEDLIRHSRETVELIAAYGADLGQASYDAVAVVQSAEAMRARLYERPDETAQYLAQPLRQLRSNVSKMHSLSVRLRNDPGQILKLKEGA